jgi:m7GpppX diphosphatase
MSWHAIPWCKPCASASASTSASASQLSSLPNLPFEVSQTYKLQLFTPSNTREIKKKEETNNGVIMMSYVGTSVGAVAVIFTLGRSLVRGLSNRRIAAAEADTTDTTDTAVSSNHISDLGTFHVERILKHSPHLVNVLGHFNSRNDENANSDDEKNQAVVTVSHIRLPDDMSDMESVLRGMNLEETMQNDIYSQFTGYVNPADPASIRAVGKLSVRTIYPCQERHILKNSHHPRYMVRESKEHYESIHLPKIESMDPKRIQWVYNILEKKAEVERILYEDLDLDAGFMLLPDFKWNLHSIRDLYCLVLCMRRDIRTLRDLRAEHLPLLRNIRDSTAKFIAERFDVQSNQLRMYVHYAPSYYHFHVHVTHVEYDSASAVSGRAHLLDDIIEHIELDSEYYSKISLPLILFDGEELRKYDVHTSDEE